jgi:IS1 family transposase
MNRLDTKDRARVLHLLCEGQSIRAITRLTGASKNTVAKLLVDAGRACAEYQDRTLRNLTCKRVQVDEIWSFVYAKQSQVKGAKAAPKNAGDAWTWTAIDADTKLLVTWLVGQRNTDYALHFLHDLKGRLANRVQLTSDGHRSYLVAVDSTFGDDVDYAMLVKLYSPAVEGERRYSPPVCIGARKTKLIGEPDPKHVSTSYAERHNLTMRMHMRRLTRLTNAFSKKLENHECAVALHAMYYNFVRQHQTLRVSPAMGAGITSRLWEIGDIVNLLEEWESEQVKLFPVYTVRENKIGGGFYVRAVKADGSAYRVDGFASESEAIEYIDRHRESRKAGRRRKIAS